MTDILLSSAVTGLSVSRAFRLAHSLIVDGIELFPFRWTTPASVSSLVDRYNMPVKGIHYPFWWNTKSLSEVVRAEDSTIEKILARAYTVFIGSAGKNCRAAELARLFPEAYNLIHGDVFRRVPLAGRKELFGNRKVLIENERPKRGEPGVAYDPYLINESLTKNIGLMFDPRHFQIGQQMGHLPIESLGTAYRRLRPQGLHFSFMGRGFRSSLPTREVWLDLAPEIKRNPPKYIVLEVTRNKKDLYRAREMLRQLLGK